ncbi:MAG TPA: PDZ domain-containing protein [Longimicrobiales bacterium]
MIRREISLALVFAITAAGTLAAQNARGTSCAAKDAVGFLGISGVDCNCTIGSADPDKWAFRTEPRITSLETDTRSGKILKPGDVITHIDGHLITTREGARAMASIRPGQAVVLTIRRNGESLKFALTAESSCPGDARLGIYAPGRPQGHAPSAYGVVTPRPPAGARASATTPRPAAAPVTPRPQSRTRGSFGFGLMCSGNCEIRAESSGALYFSEPPEVYSVERGSGADKAGVRRGDVITHVNDKSITSKDGGKIFGTAKPGQTLRFTIRRGGSTRTVSLTAAPAAAPVVELTKSSEALVRAQQSLRELQREQQRQLEQIQEDIKRSRAAEENRLRDMQREFYRQEQEHRRKLVELSSELARAELRMRAALADSLRSSCAVPTPRAGSRTLRYTGVVADTEIEVHGPNPVWVNETDNEVTITAGQTQIKVKKSNK